MALRELSLLTSIVEVETAVRVPSAHVLRHSPAGRVPALVLCDGITLTETMLILGWLADREAGRAFLPKHPARLAILGRALGLLDGIAVWNRELRRPKAARSASLIAFEQARAERIADAIERDVGAGALVEVDAAFLALASVLGYVDYRHSVWSWRRHRTSLEQWYDVASSRAAFRATLPLAGSV